MSGNTNNAKVQIIKEENSYDAPPLDFSFKSIKDLKDILFEEPRKGKRKPIIEEEKKEDKNKDAKGIEENKKTEEKEEIIITEEAQPATNEGDKKQDTEKNEEEADKPKEKEEIPKQAPDKINIIPEAHIQNFAATHNHTLHAIAKAPGVTGKTTDDVKVFQTKQVKVNLVCVSLILSYNEIRHIEGMYDIINKVMFNCRKLSWIDLSHNYLVQLADEFHHFPELRTLNIHCNYIHDLNELRKLQQIKTLKSLTIHGNPLDLIPNFRLYIIGLLPQIQKLDTVLVTKKERDNAHVFAETFNHKKFPKVNPKEIAKPPEPAQNRQNDQTDS